MHMRQDLCHLVLGAGSIYLLLHGAVVCEAAALDVITHIFLYHYYTQYHTRWSKLFGANYGVWRYQLDGNSELKLT